MIFTYKLPDNLSANSKSSGYPDQGFTGRCLTSRVGIAATTASLIMYGNDALARASYKGDGNDIAIATFFIVTVILGLIFSAGMNAWRNKRRAARRLQARAIKMGAGNQDVNHADGFDVVFTGNLAAGHDIAAIYRKLASIQSVIGPVNGDTLCVGQSSLIKGGLSREVADLLQSVLLKAGAECEVRSAQ